MNKTIPPTSQPPAMPQKAKSPRSRVMLISAGIAATAVILAGIGGAYVVPKLMHQVQVAEYQSYIETTNQARAAENKAVVEAAALAELIPVQERAASTFAASIEGLSSTAAPVFTAETAAELKAASEALAKSAPTEVDSKAGNVLQMAFDSQIKSDNERVSAATAKLTEQQAVKLAAAKDEAAKRKIEAETAKLIEAEHAESIPTYALDLTSADAIGLLDLSEKPLVVDAVSSTKVNSELVAAALVSRDAATKAQRDAEHEVAELQKRVDKTARNVAATVAALNRAAAEAPSQVTAIVAAAPRAGAAQQAALTTAAASAGDKDTVAASSPSELLALVQGYQSAALAVTNHHAAVLAEEAAAAAAAAATANGGGWSDGSSGGWNDGGGWSGSGGGGWDGGSNNTGTSGNSGPTNSGGGSTTPPSGGGSECDWGCDPEWHPWD